MFSLSPQSVLFSQLVQRFSLSIQSAEYTLHQACWPFPQRCYLGIQVPGCGPREKSVDLGLNAGSSSGKSLASSKAPQHWDIPSQGCTVFWFVFLVLSTLSQAPLCRTNFLIMHFLPSVSLHCLLGSSCLQFSNFSGNEQQQRVGI